MSVRSMQQRYIQAVGSSVALYQGPEYPGYIGPSTAGNPFFGSGKQVHGSLQYHDYFYTGVPLQYDIRLDVLVVNSYGSPAQLMLAKEHISNFEVEGHRFVRIVPVIGDASVLTAGFYELLYESGGALRVLARHNKQVQETSGQRVGQRAFVSSVKYWLEKNGNYFPVAKKGSVIAALGDRKKELKKYAAAQNLSFGPEQRSASIVALVTYYRSLASESAK